MHTLVAEIGKQLQFCFFNPQWSKIITLSEKMLKLCGPFTYNEIFVFSTLSRRIERRKTEFHCLFAVIDLQCNSVILILLIPHNFLFLIQIPLKSKLVCTPWPCKNKVSWWFIHEGVNSDRKMCEVMKSGMSQCFWECDLMICHLCFSAVYYHSSRFQDRLFPSQFTLVR